MSIRLPRKPLAIWAEEHGVSPEDYDLPPITAGLRELFFDVVVYKRVIRAIAKAPRGGGKTLIASVIEFTLWFLDHYDWVNLGGSEKQARVLYGYIQSYLEDNPPLMPDERTGLVIKSVQSETISSTRAWLKILTASTRQTRGPHAGDGNRGGGLTLDEEMETEEDVVEAAKWIINTANPGVTLRISTFHKTHGTFQEVWDQAKERGYTRYEWDIFDVCQKCHFACACEWVPPEDIEATPDLAVPDVADDATFCPVTEFVRDYYIEHEDGENELLHRAYCGGKAQYSEGWIPIDNVVQMWQDTDRANFEVEGMGWRPSAGGLVIKDLDALDEMFVDEEPPKRKGVPGVIGIDWGLQGECSIGALQMIDGDIWLVDYDFYTGVPDTTIYEVVAEMARVHGIEEVNGDASHPYCNLNLKRPPYRLKVRPINFGVLKELGVGNVNKWVEDRRFKIPMGWRDPVKAQRYQKLKSQIINWRRDKNGKIVKRDDHGPDMILCGLLKWLRQPTDQEHSTVSHVETHTFGEGEGTPETPDPDEVWVPQMK